MGDRYTIQIGMKCAVKHRPRRSSGIGKIALNLLVRSFTGLVSALQNGVSACSIMRFFGLRRFDQKHIILFCEALS